ncbi:MAG: hypothetical protein QOI20_2877, partial [Acidimicrobiaceae bacterium]|nr:hypothetical protein [Acidimicrobiaceae bacterium]
MVRVYIGYEYFHNLVDESQKKGVDGVSTIQGGAAFRF